MTQNSAPGPALVWFRTDLRIADNPALYHACRSGFPIIPVYILDEGAPHAPGGAARWWLHHSLKALDAEFAAAGCRLILRRGESAEILTELVKETAASSVYWNRRYAPAQMACDQALKASLGENGVAVHSYNGSLLREPWELTTGAGSHYKVFTPFWRALQKAGPARAAPLARPKTLEGPKPHPHSDALEDWRLIPRQPNWAQEFAPIWTPGEDGARGRLHTFLDTLIHHYTEGRDRPDVDSTSRLSPHLAFGEISSLTIWCETRARVDAGAVPSNAAQKFLAEIAWREFSYNLLYHYPDLSTQPLRKQFEAFEWRDNDSEFNAWCNGLTGYPIVDAGLRQLWRTGWMHNRVRMIVASFLTKDLLIPWQKGERWFWDTLVDADPASNAASWQWVAGCGADAAPYFRIFNPVAQGRKYDPDGDYIREYVTELAALPAIYLYAPWEAPDNVLQEAGVCLGKSYPRPMLDHGAARRRALERYDRVKAR